MSDARDVAGTEVIVDVGPVAHGGFCVARHEGRAVFVRHSLPGERVRAVVTEGTSGSRYWRADAVEVLDASPDRVIAPCPYAAPGRCGGCDWQHASLPAQRRLKAAVVSEQLARLAGLEMAVIVEPVPGDHDGLYWRTRVRFAVDESGRAGLRRHRSHHVEPIEDCLIAHPGIAARDVLAAQWASDEVLVAVSASGERAVHADAEPVSGPAPLTERAAGRVWQVRSDGFWQVHPGAADALCDAVLDALVPEAGESVLDLYAGVGLFAGAIGTRVGPAGSVVAMESDRQAVADARENLAELPWVTVVGGRVDRRLRERPVDLVVLDPPRSGAGASVVRRIARCEPRAVAYVACDPAALARDVATFDASGYRLAGLRAFDLFPMTHHVECVALLQPAE
ncbi:MAG TPA: TRAM domain-containing protein [Jiangellaceae bacterium]